MPNPQDIHAAPSSTEGAAVRIERFYTQQILSGSLAPGSRLPPSNEIAQQWSVSATAVQKAMRRLSTAGLVNRERKSGTIVRDRKERAVIGLVIGPSLADETAYYYRALATILEAQLSEYGFACRIYDGVHPMSLPATRDYHPIDMLKTDMVYYTFKGIIFIVTGHYNPVKLLPEPLPHVKLQFPPTGTTDIITSIKSSLEEILNFLYRKNHRHALLVSTIAEQNMPTTAEMALQEIPIAEDMQIDKLPLCTYAGRGHHMEKLGFDRMLETISEWKACPEKKPDSIIVTDDIVARGVCMALLKSQIEVPGEIKIVVKSNETIVHHYGMPVIRYETSVKEAAQKLISLLWKRMNGDPEPKNPHPLVIKGKLILEPEN